MAKKEKIGDIVSAKATASATIKYVRETKKQIKEVIPPEVTRMKAGAFLDLFFTLNRMGRAQRPSSASQASYAPHSTGGST